MFQQEFLKDYLKNPFFWWGTTLFFLTKIDANSTANLILRSIVIDALYVPVLFICVAIAFFLAFYPIRKGLKQLLLKKKIMKFLIYYFLICLVILVHVVYFFIGPYEILGKLDSEFVTKKLEFENDMNLTTLIETLAIPLLYAFSITVTKIALKQEKCEIDDKFVKNLKFGGYVAIICALLYIVDIFISLRQ